MPETVDWRTSDPAEVLNDIVRHWGMGRLAVLPTEAGFEAAASALHPDAVRQLQALAPGEPAAVVLSGTAEVFDWLPLLRGPGLRFLRRLPAAQWQLQADVGFADSLLSRLPAEVQAIVAPDHHVTLRWPELPLWWQALRMLRGPVVSVPLPAGAVPADALVVEAGELPPGPPTTLVRVTGRSWEIRREGSVSAEQLAEAALCRLLFVCTGNTCRSPLAEALCVRLLAERLGCAPEELKRRGFLVQSAGLAAMIGEEAAAEAVATARALGADLSRHRSQPITYELYAQADYVFAMTASHLYALQGVGLGEPPPLRLLSPGGDDVADPLGGDDAVYQACAQEILGHLQQWLPQILQAS